MPPPDSQALRRALTPVLLLTTTGFDDTALDVAAEQLLDWGIGSRNTRTARMTWGSHTHHAPAHYLSRLGPSEPQSPPLHLARLCLAAASSPAHAKLQLARYWTETGIHHAEAARIEAEVAVENALKLVEAQRDVRTLWEAASEQIRDGGLDIRQTADALKSAALALRHGETMLAPEPHLAQPTVYRVMMPVLMSALRVAFTVGGGETLSARERIESALHALKVDDVHPDAWHFGKGGDYAFQVTEFREQPYGRLQWLSALYMAREDNIEQVVLPLKHTLIRRVTVELERLARLERDLPALNVHTRTQQLMVMGLYAAARTPMPCRQQLLDRLPGELASVRLHARLVTLSAHHTPALRAPRALALAAPQTGGMLER